MPIDLTDPIFNDESAAWKHFEAIRWPEGPVCPHCGTVNKADPIIGKSARNGLYRCRAEECRRQFTATIGTVFERSHIPMHKWLLATHLLCSSKKGMSAHQLFRNLGLGSYRTAWFMAHRIREAMGPAPKPSEEPIVESDEALEADRAAIIGGAKNRAHDEPARRKSRAALVSHESRPNSLRAPKVTGKSIREILDKRANKNRSPTTDDRVVSPNIGKDSADRFSDDPSTKGFVTPGDRNKALSKAVENYYSILKRAFTGVYHGVSETHLDRYLVEFDFRYSNRSKLGIGDAERAERALKGAEHKRLFYAEGRQGERQRQKKAPSRKGA